MGKRKRSALEELMEEEEKSKQRIRQMNEASHVSAAATAAAASSVSTLPASHVDHWICPGIIVKIMNKTLAHGEFYKAKAEITAVHDTYIAELCVLETNDVIRIDQAELETVIPGLQHELNVRIMCANAATFLFICSYRVEYFSLFSPQPSIGLSRL